MEIPMNDELTKCYDLLGLSPGASPEELKVAYRDLAKVWHPDRFLHDLRLQEKAQEKLKKINEAYDLLRSGKAQRETWPPASKHDRHTSPTQEHFDHQYRARAQSGSVAVARKISWELILAPVIIFAAVFFVTYRSLLRPSEQDSRAPAIEQAEGQTDPENTLTNELINGTDRLRDKAQREEEPPAASTSQVGPAVPPMPTVTVEIDAYTGMIARRDCPVKSTLTYPSGKEPQQRCTAVHPAASVSKDSRVKSVVKRLASPGKWFGDGEKPAATPKQDPDTP